MQSLKLKYRPRKHCSKYCFFIFAITLFAAAQLHAQDLNAKETESVAKKAQDLAREGKYDVKETLKLLQDKSTFIRYQIMLLEMLGRIEEAALLAKTGSDAYSAYSSALLLYELGSFQASEAESKKLLLNTKNLDHDLNAKVNNLLASIYAITGRNQEAESTFLLLIKRFSDVLSAPVFYLNYLEFLFAQGKKEEAEDLLKTLEHSFPDSPEYQLALKVFDSSKSSYISYAPSPVRFLASKEINKPVKVKEETEKKEKVEDTPIQEEKVEPAEVKVLVQTGSFIDPDNAVYMVKDLKDRGFNASIREAVISGKKYYRVVIGTEQTPEKAQNLLLRLKETGFEGVLLFPDPKD